MLAQSSRNLLLLLLGSIALSVGCSRHQYSQDPGPGPTHPSVDPGASLAPDGLGPALQADGVGPLGDRFGLLSG